MISDIPLTATMSGLGCVVMAGAWLYIGYQIKKNSGATQRPVIFMHRFFLYMTIFTGLISLPYIWLRVSDSAFSEAMAWGYVVGHIFTYLALMYVSRMVFALIPRLASYDRLLVWLWLLANVTITTVNAVTMIWGTQPIYNYDLNLTEFRAAPAVGLSIIVMAVFSIVPAVILFFVGAFKSRGIHKIKSFLLAVGFLIFMIAGPIHDVAKSGAEYAIGDILSMVAVVLIGAGVAFRFQQGLAPAPAIRQAVAPPSNTV